MIEDSPKTSDYSKATGTGILMLHANGNLYTRELEKNEVIKLNKKSIIAIMDSVSAVSTVDPNINQLNGPGRIWLQSLDYDIN